MSIKLFDPIFRTPNPISHLFKQLLQFLFSGNNDYEYKYFGSYTNNKLKIDFTNQPCHDMET